MLKSRTITCPRCGAMMEVTNPNLQSVRDVNCPTPDCKVLLHVSFDDGETVLAEKKERKDVPGQVVYNNHSPLYLKEGKNDDGSQDIERDEFPEVILIIGYASVEFAVDEETDIERQEIGHSEGYYIQKKNPEVIVKKMLKFIHPLSKGGLSDHVADHFRLIENCPLDSFPGIRRPLTPFGRNTFCCFSNDVANRFRLIENCPLDSSPGIRRPLTPFGRNNF